MRIRLRLRRSPFVLLLGAVLTPSLLLTTSCNLPKGELTVDPLFSYSRTTAGDTRVIVRPLGSYEKSKDSRDISILWPLVRLSRDGNDRRRWLMPVFNQMVRSSDAGDDRDQFLLPSLFWGSDPREGKYLAALPVGGTLKGLFGQDRVDVALFPLYMRIKNRTGTPRERRSHHLLWPLINWVRGESDSGGRIFPFYAHYTAKNEKGEPHYDRRAILWPFWIHNREALDSERPTELHWLFPIYGRTRSTGLSRDSILWPLFQYTRHHSRTKNLRKLTLFPMTFSWGQDVSQIDLWPIFGYRKTPTYYRQSFLWLVQRYERAEARGAITENYWFLPVYWHHRRRNIEDGTERSHTRLWPVFSNSRDADGTRRFYAPDLLPFRDPERFEPLYARLWRLYRYIDRGPELGRRWDVLWGLFRGESRPEASRLSLLAGLVSRTRDGDAVRWRIFFIPFGE